MDRELFYTVKETAEVLGIKENHVRQLIWRGKFQLYKLAGVVLILKSEVEDRMKIIKVD